MKYGAEIARAVNLVTFQAAWVGCAAGAAQGDSGPGLLACAICLLLHFAGSDRRRSDVVSVLAAGCVGAVVESFLAASGLVKYGAPWPSDALAPAWIVGLWMSFGTTLRTIDDMTGWLAAYQKGLLGAAFAVLSYLAAAAVGALTLAEPIWPSLLAISSFWAFALPLLLRLARR